MTSKETIARVDATASMILPWLLTVYRQPLSACDQAYAIGLAFERRRAQAIAEIEKAHADKEAP